AATVSQLRAQLQGDLQVQEAQVSRLQAEYDNALVEYRRFQDLFEEGATSASLRDARETEMIAAKRRLQEAQETRQRIATTGRDRIKQAEATLDRIREVRPEDVTVAQTEVAGAIAAQRRAEIAFKDATIRAPVAGKILQIHTRSGEVVSSDGIVTLGRTNAMYAIAEVYEADIGRIKAGQKATVTSEYGGFEGALSGTVERVGLEILNNSLYDPNPVSQSEARVVEVAVRLDAGDSDRVSNLTNLQVRVLIDAR
ncbi:MAG: HlyD family efflux transporter periplasmic adaptor subunit, partial [Cyanobacteria bacterium P01_F01_bin.153]